VSCMVPTPQHNTYSMVLVGLLAGIQARTERPEYARLLSDCQILYCDTRLQLVSGVTHDAILHMSSQTLPVLAREGWGYLMQVRPGLPSCMRHTPPHCVPHDYHTSYGKFMMQLTWISAE